MSKNLSKEVSKAMGGTPSGNFDKGVGQFTRRMGELGKHITQGVEVIETIRESILGAVQGFGRLQGVDPSGEVSGAAARARREFPRACFRSTGFHPRDSHSREYRQRPRRSVPAPLARLSGGCENNGRPLQGRSLSPWSGHQGAEGNSGEKRGEIQQDATGEVRESRRSWRYETSPKRSGSGLSRRTCGFAIKEASRLCTECDCIYRWSLSVFEQRGA